MLPQDVTREFVFGRLEALTSTWAGCVSRCPLYVLKSISLKSPPSISLGDIRRQASSVFTAVTLQLLSSFLGI